MTLASHLALLNPCSIPRQGVLQFSPQKGALGLRVASYLFETTLGKGRGGVQSQVGDSKVIITTFISKNQVQSCEHSERS